MRSEDTVNTIQEAITIKDNHSQILIEQIAGGFRLLVKNSSKGKNAHELIKEVYQPAIEKIENSVDEKEAAFLEYLRSSVFFSSIQVK
ncbi:hypothetical protein DRJ16_04995 [Candidatus Woesearchaeota archaeon]|nr:MAG: hypothetical protein DRJ16_04995 [Candidatus Woesearchaeota archaeon]